MTQDNDTAPSAPQDTAARLSQGLYPHQIEGIAFLLGRRRSILADDMGLGKTRQSILSLDHVAGDGSFLVICPASVKTNWQREIHQVLPDTPVAIIGPAKPPAILPRWIVINYDILGKHLEWLERDWAGIICDEAHFLKNYKSKRHTYVRRLVGIQPDNTPLHLLTGTPLTNRPRDLFPLLQLINHPLGRNFLAFAKRYCDAHQGEYGWITDGASHIDELAVQLHGIMVRRTKKEVLDLPPKIRTWLDVEVASNVARALSKAVMDLMVDSVDGQKQRSGTVLGQLTTARNRLAIAKVRSTLPLIEDMVEQGEKVLVFSCFIRPLDIIQKKFKQRAVSIPNASASKAPASQGTITSSPSTARTWSAAARLLSTAVFAVTPATLKKY
jgi:SWI/SNF-related matrix-associated actin-dependent regulator of chromatin subfamily A-like protein 1